MIQLQTATLKNQADPSASSGLALQRLEHLLTQEQKVLNSGSVSGLDMLAGQKQQLISQIRLSLATGSLRDELKADAARAPWKALREGLAAAAILNRDNGLLAGRQLDYLRARQSGLMGAARATDSYRYDGSSSAQRPSGSTMAIA